MAFVAIQCPDCGRGFVINGNGRCRCGTRLIHHVRRGGRLIHSDERTLLWNEAGRCWFVWDDPLRTPEPARWRERL